MTFYLRQLDQDVNHDTSARKLLLTKVVIIIILMFDDAGVLNIDIFENFASIRESQSRYFQAQNLKFY